MEVNYDLFRLTEGLQISGSLDISGRFVLEGIRVQNIQGMCMVEIFLYFIITINFVQPVHFSILDIRNI